MNRLTYCNILPALLDKWASQVAQWERIRLPIQQTQEMQVRPLGWEDSLEKEMATHSSILAQEIPWTEEPGGLQSMGSQRVGHDLVTEQPRIARLCGSK